MKAKPKFRFAMRTLLIFMLSICPVFAWFGYHFKERGREQAALEKSQFLVVRNGDFQVNRLFL